MAAEVRASRGRVELCRAVVGLDGVESCVEVLCRLHGNRDRFLCTATSSAASGALRFSGGGSDGRGRCEVILALFERGMESSRKPPELGALRCPGVLRSPSRELLPNVLPSNSPLARPSLIGPVARRKGPSLVWVKGDRVPVGAAWCCPSEGDIEFHALGWWRRRQQSRGVGEVLDGHSHQ